ncbi:hypothetical protein Tco_0133893 [Tanacetum coccineum]
MAAPVISISSNLSDESVGSSIPRVILIGYISVEVLVVQEVGVAAVASPVGVLELDTHSSSKADPSESLLPLVSVAPMVSPFLCSDDPKSNTEMLGRALTARKSVRPLPSHRLALRYTSHHLDRFTSESSSDHSSSDHSSSGPIAVGGLPPLSTMYPPTTSESSAGDSSFETSAESSRKRCRSPAATVTLSIPALGALVPSHTDLLPPCKRFRDSISPEDSVEDDIDADVLTDVEADATAIEVAADMDVEVGVDANIGMEVDVGVDIEDEVEGEVESSDRGTIEVGVDVVAGIDVPDGMLMPDAVEHLEQVEEVVQDIYGHVMEIPLQRVEDIKTGQRELEARSLIASGERAGLLDNVASLERSNTRL